MPVPQLPRLSDLDLEGQWVLVRADLNVPLTDGDVVDDFRIGAFVPTLERLMHQSCRVVICSHLGRPEGVDEAYRMRPVAGVLSELVSREVTPVPEVVGPGAEAAVSALEPGHIVLLENLRFHPGEETNEPAFCDELARFGQVYVNDAFGSSHRAHASIVGLPERLPSYAGLLLAEEVETLTELLEAPEDPFVVILGGAKVADKIGVVRRLLEKADRICIGGGMAFTFLQANGYEVGRSVVEHGYLAEVEALLKEAEGRILLPTDVVCADNMQATEGRTTPVHAIPRDEMALDIGPDTASRFVNAVGGAATVFWNGPMGVFENPAFASGTRTVAEAVAACRGRTVTGGGETASALASLGLDEDVDFASTGGGAALEFLEGRTLPGIAALERVAGRQQSID